MFTCTVPRWKEPSPAGRIEISAQNHNYAVDPSQLPPDVDVTHINLNDGTCAGILCTGKKAMSIQYHPEASPGPHDSDICFEQFMNMIKAEQGVAAWQAASENIGTRVWWGQSG